MTSGNKIPYGGKTISNINRGSGSIGTVQARKHVKLDITSLIRTLAPSGYHFLRSACEENSPSRFTLVSGCKL